MTDTQYYGLMSMILLIAASFHAPKEYRTFYAGLWSVAGLFYVILSCSEWLRGAL